MQTAASLIGPFLSGSAQVRVRRSTRPEELFAAGRIHLSTSAIHTVKPLRWRYPRES